VVRLAAQADTVAAEPYDRCDDADLEAGRLEHGALLDVQLEARGDLGDPVRLRDVGEGEAGSRHRLSEGRSSRVDAVAEAVHVVADERAAAEERSVEARALLVHERGHPDRPRRLEALLLEEANGVHRGDDAEGAVESAAGRNGVEVRSDEHRSAAPALPAREQIARSVDFDLEAKRA
jgi:hypothetical protein